MPHARLVSDNTFYFRFLREAALADYFIRDLKLGNITRNLATIKSAASAVSVFFSKS